MARQEHKHRDKTQKRADGIICKPLQAIAIELHPGERENRVQSTCSLTVDLTQPSASFHAYQRSDGHNGFKCTGTAYLRRLRTGSDLEGPSAWQFSMADQDSAIHAKYMMNHCVVTAQCSMIPLGVKYGAFRRE